MGSEFGSDCCLSENTGEFRKKYHSILNKPHPKKQKQNPITTPSPLQPETSTYTDDDEPDPDILKFNHHEPKPDLIISYWLRTCSLPKQPSTHKPYTKITTLIIHYTQFFEFQSNHPRITISNNGLIATHNSGLGDATIMFGTPFPFLSHEMKKKNGDNIDDHEFRSIFGLDLKILECGCNDNIGIAFVPKSFTHLKESPYNYKYTYIIYSDGVYHDWDQKCKHSQNNFTFYEQGTILRIVIDNLNGVILIINKNKNNKKHIINIHNKYCFNQNGGKQQMRFAFVMYSGGGPENSKIKILNQAWKSQR